MNKKDFGLSGNLLKVIAAAAMLIDHLGYVIFPELLILRIIGRISFPIFAFMIYEGCRYTRNKIKYILQIFILGVVCAVAVYVTQGFVYLNVLITFSFSIILIFLLQFAVKTTDGVLKLTSLALCIVITIGVYFLKNTVELDYGFFGVLLPVFPALIDLAFPQKEKKLLVLTPQFYFFAAGLALVCVEFNDYQYYSLITLALLAFYNGKRGFRLTKYFFYIFYPAHMVLVWLLSLII